MRTLITYLTIAWALSFHAKTSSSKASTTPIPSPTEVYFNCERPIKPSASRRMNEAVIDKECDECSRLPSVPQYKCDHGFEWCIRCVSKDPGWQCHVNAYLQSLDMRYRCCWPSGKDEPCSTLNLDSLSEYLDHYLYLKVGLPKDNVPPVSNLQVRTAHGEDWPPSEFKEEVMDPRYKVKCACRSWEWFDDIQPPDK